MLKQIEQLNRRLGESLGFVQGGTRPRFQWMFSPDVQYFYRAPTGIKYERQCWADRVGKVWMLCQWRPPAMTEAEWVRSFGGEFPYPRNGMYYAHPETALPSGVLPNGEVTQGYIWSLDQQMSKKYSAHKRQIDGEIESAQERDYVEWVEQVQNTAPAFNNWEPGKRGNNVSFGGI